MKLFYRRYGSGPSLIILHGLYGSSDNWITIARMVEDHYTVYLPDQRNHGQSPHSDETSYDSMSNDLLELADELKLDKFFLAGHSMGGKTAMTFALRWPERLNGLLIADISPFINDTSGKIASEHHQKILKAMMSLDLNEIGSRAEADSQLMKLIGSDKIRGFILKNLYRNSDNSYSWKINVRSLLKNLSNLIEGINRNSILNKQITGFPVIFLKGSDSEYLNPADYNDIQKVFPAAEIIEVLNAGHWIHADQPGEIASNLKKLSGND